MSKQENDVDSIKALFAKHGFTLAQTAGKDFAIVCVYAHGVPKPNSAHRQNTLIKALEDARDNYFGYCLGAWSIKDELKHLLTKFKSTDDPKRHLAPGDFYSYLQRFLEENEVTIRLEYDSGNKKHYCDIQPNPLRLPGVDAVHESGPTPEHAFDEAIAIWAERGNKVYDVQSSTEPGEIKLTIEHDPKRHLTPCVSCGKDATGRDCNKISDCVICDSCGSHNEHGKEQAHTMSRCPKCESPDAVAWSEYEDAYFCRTCKNTIDHFKRDPITKQRYIHINTAEEHKKDNPKRTHEQDPPSKLPRELHKLERRISVLEEVVKVHKGQLQDRKRTARAAEQLSEEKMWARFFLHSSSEKPRGNDPKWHLTPCPRCGKNTTATSCGKLCVTCDACQVHIDNAREVCCPNCGSCDVAIERPSVYYCDNCRRYFSPVAREIQEEPIKVNIDIDAPTPDDPYRYPAEFSTSDTAVSQTNKLNALRRHCLHGHKIMSARMNKREEQILALGKRADGLNNRIDGLQADFWELEQVEEKTK